MTGADLAIPSAGIAARDLSQAVKDLT